MAEEKQRPAANFIGSKGPDGNIEFDDRAMSMGAWPAKTKGGDTYMRGKCPHCGSKIWAFMNKKEGWKIVKENVQEDTDW
jgi:DNA-directed RNA polymerase subunit RPC12/RpoP